MNGSASNLTRNAQHDRQAGGSDRLSTPFKHQSSHIIPGGTTAAKALAHMVRLAAVAIVLNCHGTPVFAGPQIEISFEVGAADNQKLVHAQALFTARRSVVYDIFDGITTYPMLHEWIRKTTLVGTGKDSQEFLVEFAFPWPVGRQWSRVEVRHSGNTMILWKQVEGSLKANDGRISFTSSDSEVHIDYRAAIDVGLPELWTQTYKEKFIREFLTAAYEQATATASPAAFVLAAEP